MIAFEFKILLHLKLMDPKRRFEKTNQIIEELIECVEKENSLIVVEGKRDLESLISLGIEKNKILMISQTPDYFLREYLLENNFTTIIDMLDSDKEGRKMSERLESTLSFVKIEKRFKKLTKLLNTAFVEDYAKSYSKIKENLTSFIYV